MTRPSLTPTPSVPFLSNDTHGGMSMSQGTILVDDEDVVIEVEVSLLGLFKRPPRTFRFDMTDLEEIRHRRGPFRDTLRIRTRPMDRVTQVPGSKDGMLTLRISRRHRAAVDRLLSRLEMWVS